MSDFIFEACLFDLDGVIVHTSGFHYESWKRVADAFGVEFTEALNENLKGVSRTASLDYILGLGDIKLSQEEKDQWCVTKNEWYVEKIKSLTSNDTLDGVVDLIKALRAASVKVGLGSASKNARLILEQLDMIDLFDIIVDGTNTTKSKPDPEVFLLGADGVGCPPRRTVVFEDALAGLEAARTGGFFAFGIGDAAVLNNAHVVEPHFENLDLDRLLELIEQTEF